MYKFLLFFTFIIVAPLTVNADSIYVPASGKYEGPLHTSPSPVVVELFSSENCPACPPADEYIKELSQSKGVIALSCHVDYFGKTGLGKEFCTDRQTRYIEQIGRKSHFTPQMMINGHMSEIGYETANVAAAIVKGRSERVQEINITHSSYNTFDIDLKATPSAQTADLWMVMYQKPKTLNKRGKKVTYYNVIDGIISLGQWRGQKIKKFVQPIMTSTTSGFAVIAQDTLSGKIIAAGDYKLEE